ncbi:amine oxidase catalytic domain-containing protein [Bimuria novae-zelandiae CBS 107.79]|uniref:Amine oxidase n=1 Tax=Bimuria novae-zelandiae CBS 107.79 TaxID=1447943 RepID=A0A6A5UQ14_9PLEO|nr:amine oxidase catalytic domain-containing protein [Bimuria novae-zelandiae CBS 107.79]
MQSIGSLTLVVIFLFFQTTIQDLTECATDQPTTNAPRKNVWRPLSEQEVLDVGNIVTQKFTLNPTPAPNTTETVAVRIEGVSLLQPNKSDVLPFLDGHANEPSRYARTTVLFLSLEGPSLREYVVGPLSGTNATQVVPLTFPFNNKQPGKSRYPSIRVPDSIDGWVAALSEEIANITSLIWNSTILEGGVGLRLGNVFFEEDGAQSSWATLLGRSSSFESVTLLPLGVFLHLDVTSLRWQDWKITGWYSRGVFYENTRDFEAAVSSADFENPPPNVDGPWISTDKQGELPLDNLPPPATVSGGKRRFSVDRNENYVSWMDFSFYTATSPKEGLSLHDVRYKGQRVLYELALQEALAHYAGADPVQSETLYFDTFGGLGSEMFPLVKDYDCPSHATYLDAGYPNAICLFEADTNFPIRRHTVWNPEKNYTSVAKNIVFTVRWISTVGNYDYLFDYNFFYDGAIEVSVRASGYISAAYYADNDDFGFRIHDFLSGSLHDHVMTFKADLDVLGEKNSVQKLEIIPATVEYPWSGGRTRHTMKLEKSFVTIEDDASIMWAPNDAAIYSIVNKDSPNKYGEYPGYRVKRSAGATHLTVKDSSNGGNALHYATADLFVTKQKDTEPKAADWANSFDVNDPLVDFSKFLDGESLEQEDLVLWFNLGMHHVPHTGDLPNTVMTSAHSAIRLEPINYLLNDPSVQSSQQIRINRTSGTIERFDAQSANCSVDLSAFIA